MKTIYEWLFSDMDDLIDCDFEKSTGMEWIKLKEKLLLKRKLMMRTVAVMSKNYTDTRIGGSLRTAGCMSTIRLLIGGTVREREIGDMTRQLNKWVI